MDKFLVFLYLIKAFRNLTKLISLNLEANRLETINETVSIAIDLFLNKYYKILLKKIIFFKAF